MIILDLSHPIVWLVRHMRSNKAEFSFLQKKTDQSKKEISWLCLLQDLRFAPFVFFGFVFKVQKIGKKKGRQGTVCTQPP